MSECKDWVDALAKALASEDAARAHLRPFIEALYARKAFKLADGLNADFRGLILASATCEHVHESIIYRSKSKLSTDHERRISYPFYTDAVIAAYNIRMIFKRDEWKDAVGLDNRDHINAIFDAQLPMTIEASHALRHNHDRSFGYVRGRRYSDKQQFIAVFGASIKLTDVKMDDFWYKFSLSSIVNLLDESVKALSTSQL